jgi:hypothetical protein
MSKAMKPYFPNVGKLSLRKEAKYFEQVDGLETHKFSFLPSPC